MKLSPIAVVWAALGWSVALGAQAPPSTTPKPPSTAERLDQLESRIELLESWLTGVDERTPDRTAYLNCNTGGYSQLVPKSGHLVFLAACEKIEPFLEGFRLTIALGNPYSISYTSISGELGYGETFTKTYDQKLAFSVPQQIASGSWNRITVVIPRAAAKDVRSIRLTIELTTAQLSTR